MIPYYTIEKIGKIYWAKVFSSGEIHGVGFRRKASAITWAKKQLGEK